MFGSVFVRLKLQKTGANCPMDSLLDLTDLPVYETDLPVTIPVQFGLGDRYWKRSTGLGMVNAGLPAFFRSSTGIPVSQHR